MSWQIAVDSNDLYQVFTVMASVNNSLNSTTNATVDNNLGIYQYIVFGWNAPFWLTFCALFVCSIVLLFISKTEMNKNQKFMYVLVSILCVMSAFNMMTRMAAEMSFIDPDLKKAEQLYAMMKAFDRVVISWTCLVEFLLLCHISMVFLNTSKDGGALSEKKYKVLKTSIYVFLVSLVTVIVLLSITLIVMGALISKFGETPTINYLIIIVLIICALVFAALCISILVILHFCGGILLITLKQGEQKAMQMATQNMEMSQEQLRTIGLKKSALTKAWTILIVVTVDMLFQFVGFLFLPLSVLNKYLMLVYYFSYNITLVVIIALFLFLGVSNRLSNINKVFIAKTLKTPQEHDQ